MGATSFVSRPSPRVDIIHPDCDLKTMSTFHTIFLRKQAGWPPSPQVFAKNSLIKNRFEEENKFDSRTSFFR